MTTGGPPDNIKAKHRLMAVDRALGASNIEIAEKHDYSPTRISIIFQSPIMRELVQLYQDQIAQQAISKAADLAGRFDGLAPHAVTKIEELMRQSEMDTVQLASAKEILDRSPNAPKARKLIDVEARGIVLQIPTATLENMLQASRIIGEPLDVEYDEITEKVEEKEEFDDFFDGIEEEE